MCKTPKCYLNLIMMQGIDFFFHKPILQKGSWNPCPETGSRKGHLHLENSLIRFMMQDDRTCNLCFIFWLWDSTRGSLCPYLHLHRVHHCCVVSFSHSVHVSRWILADFLEKTIDNWPQWLSDTAEVWLMLESEVWKWLLPWDRMLSTARFLCELFICLLNRITPPIFLTLTL